MQRIKHIPTGLYYRPCYDKAVRITDDSGNDRTIYVKSNLSKNGKIYRAATLKWLHQGYYNHTVSEKSAKQKMSGKDFYQYYWDDINSNLKFNESEWEVEEL